MSLIAPGSKAPEFSLDSHVESTVKLAEFKGKKNVLMVFYPLDFTPT